MSSIADTTDIFDEVQADQDRSPRDTGTLGKAMAVLQIVANAPSAPRFTEILQQSDQPRGTLHRQLLNLVEEGLLIVRPDQSYELGIKLLTFAARSWSGSDFRRIAEPHIKQLQAETGETVHLAVLQGASVVYLDKVQGTQALRLHSQIGNASPAYCTGVGKAALSILDAEVLTKQITETKFIQHTEHTLLTAKALRAEIAEIRRSGIAYDREEHERGIHCVAAPIHSAARAVIGGISVTGPVFRVSRAQLEDWAPIVRTTAQHIMTDLEIRLGPRA